MRLNRFYTERRNITIGSSVKLEADQAQHIRKTLRLNPGDKIVIFNGIKEYLAELKNVRNDFARVKILKVLKEAKSKRDGIVEITLFMSLIRPKNFELVIEKCTELGVDDIVPMNTEYSQIGKERIVNKIERWEKIIIETCKQSERIKIPKLHEPIDFADFKEIQSQFDKVYLFSLPTTQEVRLTGNKSMQNIETKRVTKDVERGIKKVAYLIGPEGGFSPFEHQAAKELDLNFYTLGSTILKAETAAISALSILNFVYER